jgi:rare lipoprotein A
MPVTPRFCRAVQALASVLLGVLLVACASPVPSQEGANPAPGRTAAGRPAIPPSASAVPAPAVPTQAVASATTAATTAVPTEGAPAEAGGVSAAATGVSEAPDQPLARGLASWYGPKFHGRRTASGERYDMHGLTAAHKTLPFGTKVRVRSVQTGKEVVVRINDRGPYKRSRIIDLSLGAITALGLRHRGVTEVVLLRE